MVALVSSQPAIAGGSGGNSDDDVLWLALSGDEALEIINLIEWGGEDESDEVRAVYLRLRAMTQKLKLVVDNTTSH